MKHALSPACSVMLVLCLALITNATQLSSNISWQSYQRARDVLDSGIKAHGGLEALRSIQSFTIKESGTNLLVNQSPNPEPPYLTAPREETTVFDSRRERLSIQLRAVTPWFTTFARVIIKDGEGFNLDLLSKTATPVVPAAIVNFRRSRSRYLPHNVLLEALERASALRWLGDEDFRGRKQQVINAVLADGQQLSLHFDAQTHLLTKYESLSIDPMVGDSLTETIFPGYRSVGAFKVPTGRILTFAGYTEQETKYEDVQINSPLGENHFEIPTDFEKLPAPPPQPQNVLNKIAEDVYWLQGLSGGNRNILFVIFNDYVLVVEAPEQRPYANMSEEVIARIKETAPGKPIRYLVLTHHHWDHAGGVRSYIARGTTIVTTPGNRRFFERVKAAPFTIAPDTLARNPRPAVIETIENKKRVFRDDKHIVEVYDIGPAPHSKEMLVVYLPKEKILFQGDLIAGGFGPLPVAQESTIHLVERIRALGLHVEKLIGVHGRVVTHEEVIKAIEKRRAMNAQ